MARQLSLVSATLMTAALSGLMPTVVDHLSSPPPPPATIMPGTAMPSTAPAGGTPGTVTVHKFLADVKNHKEKKIP